MIKNSILTSCFVVTIFTVAHTQSIHMGIDGAIKIHHEGAVIPDPGTIRWSECDHEVWNGTDWVSLTSGTRVGRHLFSPTSDGTDEGKSIAVDSDKNLFLVGEYREHLPLGDTSLNSIGDSDIFIIKFDSEGQLLWARSIGGTARESVNDVEYLNGAIYITGSFSTNCSFGDTTVTSNGLIDIFIAKYSSEGDFDWVITTGSHTNDIGKSVEVDNSGFIYVSGLFQNSVNFGEQILSSLGSFDIFCIKLDEDGNYIWVNKMGGFSLDIINDLHLSKNNELLLVGMFPSSNFQVEGQTLIVQDDFDAFLIKLDLHGNLIFAKSVGGPEKESFNAVSSDSQDNIILTGEFEDSIFFELDTFISIDNQDILVAKFSSAGDEIWVKHFGGPSYDIGGQVLITPNDNILVSGYFNDSLTFDEFDVVSKGSSDIFVADLDGSGNFKSLKQFGGESGDKPNKLLRVEQQLYLTGSVSSSNIFFGTHNVGNTISGEIYLYKFGIF